MKNFEKGAIVKFTNSNGIMDGGTIIAIHKEADGVEYAMLNTLEGVRVKIKVANLISIKHQRKGVVSNKFKKRISKEIAEYNQALCHPPTDGQPKVIPRVEKKVGFTPQELDLKLLKEKVVDVEIENKRLREENEELRKKAEVNKCPYETEMLVRTIKAFKQSISDGLILSDDKSQAILPLLELIMEFNNIQEKKE